MCARRGRCQRQQLTTRTIDCRHAVDTGNRTGSEGKRIRTRHRFGKVVEGSIACDVLANTIEGDRV